MASKFEIYKDKSEEFRFRLKAANGENILASEGYKTKASCNNGIESVKKNSVIDANYERKTNSAGKYFFNLKAANSQVIGTSQAYSTEAARETGIAAVKKAAPDANVVDLTQ
jgi:uncharacterized protein YegP (UPF0339 family)